MPPQPILKICRDATVTLAPERITERPQVATQIAHCIAVWSGVETSASHLFQLLLGTNFQAGIELYNSFGGASLKQNGIKVLARAKLAPPIYAIIDALLKVIEADEKIRNKIAHWYWGISDQIGDGLALVDPKDVLTASARVRDLVQRGKKVTEDDIKIPLERVYAYRISDLAADAKTFADLDALIVKCYGLCEMDGNRLWQLRDELLQDDRLASRLNRSS
jgi:hypothetical protein